MPTHDRGDRLVRAARSVLDQDYPELELVIVDDASTDDTPATTARLAEDPRVTVVRNEVSLGPGGARNRALEVASGDLLSFCDDDDAWLPGAAAALVDRLQADPGVAVVTSWHQVVHDRTGRTVAYRGPRTVTHRDLLWFNFVALPFGVVHRDRVGCELRFDQTLPPCEDWDLWLRCAADAPVSVVPQILYAYHQHGGDRVTSVGGSGSRGGRAAFLAKHAPEMTPACRAYHRAVVAAETGGRRGLAASLAATARREPAAAAVAGSVLTSSYATSAVGIRRRDPGLPARTMQRLLAAVGEDRP
jgi:glycosyltransferase involved in cell wall biosynthesis